MERSDSERNAPLPASGGGVQLRLFAALAMPAEQASRIVDVTEAIATGAPAARVTDPDDLHVTFAFVGAVAEEHVPAIATALDAAALEVPGATGCTVQSTAPFGGGRVLGADVDVELHAVLDAARDRFVQSIRPYAPHVDDRPWRPHLSLLRVPRGTALPEPSPAQSAALANARWIAGDVRLFASLPSPSGTTYRQLHAAPLGAPSLRD